MNEYQKNPLSSTLCAFVGCGRVGTALSAALEDTGMPPILYFDIEPERAITLANKRQGAATDSLQELFSKSNLIFLTIVDDALPGFAQKQVEGFTEFHHKTVVHTSGLNSTDVLRPFREKGAHTLSLHPCISITGERTFAGIPFAIQGDDQAFETGSKICQLLGAIPIRITADAKPAYHFLATMASNFVVLLLDQVKEGYITLGMTSEQARQCTLALAESTVNNCIQLGIDNAFTGPFARGDMETIKMHQKIAHTFPPDLKALASHFFQLALDFAHQKGYISDIKARALSNIFSE